MNLYTLPSSQPYHILLTGDTDFVIEFAARLDGHQIPFNILPPMDMMDELDMELDLVDVAIGESALDSDEYGAFSDRVIGDVRSNAGSYTHIVDLSVAGLRERQATLEIAGAVNPSATVMVSSLTNTATEIGMMTGQGNRIVGVGLAPSLMSTSSRVDLAVGLNAAENHIESSKRLLETLGYGVDVVEDRVALVQMRILVMLINEAAFAVMEGVATPEDIDHAMKLGVNYPKGLLAWADEIGIPVVLLVLDNLYREYQQERYRPCVLLKQYARAGWTGKASGRGFYTY